MAEEKELISFRAAIRLGDISKVSQMVSERGDLLDALLDKEGWRAIHVASFLGKIEILTRIIQSGVDVNVKTVKNEMNSLHLACLKGHSEVTKLLIENKAEVNDKANLQWTALHLAATNGYVSCMQILLDKNADVNANRPPLGTALHLAAYGRHERLVPLLLEYKANPYALNGLLQTPLDVSQSEAIHKRLETTMNRNPASYYSPPIKKETKRRPAPERKCSSPNSKPKTARSTNKTKKRKLPKPKGKFNFPPPSEPAPPPPDEPIVISPTEMNRRVSMRIKNDSTAGDNEMKRLFSRKSVYMDPQDYVSSLTEEEPETIEESEESEEEPKELSPDELFLRDCTEQCQWFKVALTRRREKVIIQLYSALFPKYCELRKRHKENPINGANDIIDDTKQLLRECEEEFGDFLPCLDAEDLESSEDSGEWECDDQ